MLYCADLCNLCKKYPLLYDELELKENEYYHHERQISPFIIAQMKLQLSLSQFDNTELEELLLKMQAFQIWLSVLARDKSCAHILTEEKIIEMLKSMGRTVALDIASHKGRK